MKIKSHYLICAALLLLLDSVVLVHAADVMPELISAIRSTNLDVIKDLKPEAFQIAPGPSWDYPLVEACLTQNMTVLSNVLIRTSNVNITAMGPRMPGLTPLDIAVALSDRDMIKCLLRFGADTNAYTDLMIAVACQEAGRVQQVISKGVDLNVMNKRGKRAIDFAQTNRIIFKQLIAAGAEADYSREQLCAIYDDVNNLLAALHASGREHDRSHLRRILHLAIRYDSVASVRLLLELGADTGIDDARQLTALGLAAKYGRTSIVKMLLEKKVDPAELCDGYIRPATIAREFNHFDIADYIDQISRK